MPRTRLTVAALAAVLIYLLLPSLASGASNGWLPKSALAPAAQGGCVKLERNAARAYNAMQVEAGRVLPVNGCDSAYRTFPRQVHWRNVWCSRGACGNAAVPGFSNHGWGRAADIPPWVRQIIDRIGHRFGWCKVPRWVRNVWCASDAAHESWHVRYTPGVWAGGLPNMPLLAEGSHSPSVRFLRRRLRAHARRPACHLASRGWYGPKVRRCVINFQANHRLAGDGVVGPGTWKRLIAKPRRTKRR